MDRPGDTQAIPLSGPLSGNPGGFVASQSGQGTHDSLFAAAQARIDAIGREWAHALNTLGAFVGPAAEQLPSAPRIQGPMATAPITF